MSETEQSLVAKRLRYIERQRELHKKHVDVVFEGRSPEGTGPKNRHGMPKLPTGQRQVPNWPVLDLGDSPVVPLDSWRLEVGGLCESPFSVSWQEFLELPQAEDVSDFHCVTTWSRMDNTWKGVRFRTIAELAVPAPDVTHVLCTGYDHMPGTRIPYTTNLPLARAVEDDVLLVHAWEGAPLPQEHGGPCRMITPKLYAWKGTKWIRKIEFLAGNRLGFWEERGYSDTAEPWFDDRVLILAVFSAKDLRPMLATLPSQAPSLTDKAYVYEPKVDGIRAILEALPGSPKPSVRFWSRNGNEKTAQFPDIVEAVATWLKKIRSPIVLDGEIVALDEEMRPAGFQRLQHRIHVSVPGFNSRKALLPPDQQPAAFIAFDLLRDGDDDLRNLPLTERRKRLESLFKTHTAPASELVRLTAQSIGDGTELLKQANAENWEGLMVKLARSPYRAAKRSPEWIKHKLNKQDEFVVVGWTDPGGAREHFGSLVLGAHDNGSLRYAGEVGTGFKASELERVMQMLRRLETPTCPLNPKPKILSAKGTPHWVRPRLVAQVRYSEITDDGRLRHPAYLGLRDDKRAAEVTVPKVPTGSSGSKGLVPTVPVGSRVPSAKEIDAIVEQLAFLEKARKNGRITLPDGDTLEVTNLQKTFWPQIKKTKGDLIRFYAKISPFILPVIENRPLVMKRLPNGVEGPSLYQHRAPEPVPPGVRIETLPNDDVPARLVGGSLKALLYMAQLASISMDPWFSTIEDLDSADQVAIDLDPQPGATFSQILDCAEWVEEELDRVKIDGFPKTSGSEGLHVYIPLPPGTPYEAGMLFCQIIATMVAAKHPKVATVERMVRRRKDGTVYVDYLQNIQGKTLACAYSARGSAFAGVSTPLTWKEVHQRPKPQDFTIDTIHPRLKKTGDLWEKMRKHKGANLLAAIDKLRK